MNKHISILLHNKEISELIASQESFYLLSQLNIGNDELFDVANNKKLFRIISLLFNHVISDSFQIKESSDNLNLLQQTYRLFKNIDIKDITSKKDFEEIFGIETVATENLYYFYLSCLLLKTNETIKIRIDLKEYRFFPDRENLKNWKYEVLNTILESILLLTRKENGYQDIKKAYNNIISLRQKQLELEATYLAENNTKEYEEALELLGLYHLSKAIVETADYLINGYNYKQNIDNIINLHTKLAADSLNFSTALKNLVPLIKMTLKTLRNNAIWAKTTFNDKIKRFCQLKAASEQGIVDLLPSQQDALGKRFLDVASNVTVLQMPTSAGKTLLAEFDILVTKSLKPSDKIIYIVPSRALVNQIYYDLKTDFEGLDLVIEKTSSAIEIDSSEWELLESDKIDVLVSTPEKLDLLIKRAHPSVDNISLIVIDEAHTIANGQRGAKLEILLALLKRERPNAKFLLLSPFLGEKGQQNIADWLAGETQKVEPIKIDWKPAEKLVVGLGITNAKKQENIRFNVSFLKSPYSLLVQNEITKEIKESSYRIKGKGEKERIREFAIKHWAKENKTMMFLCKGKTSADNLAKEIADLSPSEPNEERTLIRRFIESEIGNDTILSKTLDKKIAVHHAGLSEEVKLLVEYLIRKREIKYVCATTTIAEGVNFPVSAVFFDSLYRGKANEIISTNDFWNIAGRAGRTMIDNFGTIIFPFNSEKSENDARFLIKNASNELASVLSDFIGESENICRIFQREENPFATDIVTRYQNSLDPLVQYIVHLISVSDKYDYAAQIDDLFKESLGYFMASSRDKEKLVDICTSIYHFLNAKQPKRVLAFSDKTGFSIGSVKKIRQEIRNEYSINATEYWEVDKLFNSEEFLVEKIRIISSLKETNIKASLFDNDELIAELLTNWVKGKKLGDIFSSYPTSHTINQKGMNEFVKNMNDMRFKASWGFSVLEGIVREKENKMQDSLIPSYIYFGVDNPKSLLLRMVGLPRQLSYSMSKVLEKELNQYSYQSVRKLIKGLTNSDWDTLIPNESTLSGMEWKKITEILVK